ncbi:hypothetical protein QC763_0017920 [Podospora pseudopauciseta]|uniref:Uncharacterized protein n=2 Tax=Podospora TaxID=5144 RepID=A0ABR0I0F1_9PEZI|nr:hypothetical protein QC763_0017920 [Podospora pseudopauciseta]KAK4682313.1 hypothetical protein QC764_0017860 [Podospora pseudoanserina]
MKTSISTLLPLSTLMGPTGWLLSTIYFWQQDKRKLNRANGCISHQVFL